VAVFVDNKDSGLFMRANVILAIVALFDFDPQSVRLLPNLQGRH